MDSIKVEEMGQGFARKPRKPKREDTTTPEQSSLLLLKTWSFESFARRSVF
ncbi:hypothetical protein [Coleofasciculus sp. G2-EDA-02]|uniref:hypothetical protein n=1 Tax=Coleofasciculus sp. G2-EDA-02 TaxID=3069529 RepID=UPI0032FA6270